MVILPRLGRTIWHSRGARVFTVLLGLKRGSFGIRYRCSFDTGLPLAHTSAALALGGSWPMVADPPAFFDRAFSCICPSTFRVAGVGSITLHGDIRLLSDAYLGEMAVRVDRGIVGGEAAAE